MRFIKGLHTDNDVLLQPPETYRYLLNGELNNEKGAIVTEKGTVLQDQIPLGPQNEPKVAIGSVVLNDNRIVIFSAQVNVGSPNHSEIGVYDSGTYTTLIADTFLDFHPDSPIQATYRVNIKGEVEVYWVRDNGPPGFINIDSPPSVPTFANTSLFFRVEKAPEFNFKRVNATGGILTTGAYQFALAYVSEDNSITNFLNISNPILVSNNMDVFLNYDGAPGGVQTGSTIEFSVTNLDKDGFFGLRVVVIKDQTTVTILPDRFIPDSAELHYTYTGGESFLPGSIDEVIIDKASYSGAKAISQLDGVLHLGNLDKDLDIGYQKYANNIELCIETVHSDPLPTVSNANRLRKYLDPVYLHKFKTFRRGEVYALYISWLLKDGTETKAYHIPGRERDPAVEPDNPKVFITTGDVRDKIGKDIEDWQINSRMGTVVGDSGSVLNTGFWENKNEFYPVVDPNLDYQVWDVNTSGVGILNTGKTALHGQPVRHHRMPENFDFPYYGTSSVGGASNPDLIKNGGFDDESNWVPNGQWDINGGIASCDMFSDPNPDSGLNQPVGFVTGGIYDVQVDITGHADAAGSNLSFYLKGGTPHIESVAVGTFTRNFTLTAGPDSDPYDLKIIASESGHVNGPFKGSIDNISIVVNASSLVNTTVFPIVPVLKNIKIPESDGSPHQTGRNLWDEVIGYKIYYAKKDASNQLILDQASTLPVTKDGEATRHRQDDINVNTPVYKNNGDVLLPHGYHKDFDLEGTGGVGEPIFITYPTAFYAHPFSSLKDGDNLSGATFVKEVALYNHVITDAKPGDGATHQWIRQWNEPQTYVYSAINQNHAIKGIGLVPHNHGEVRMDEINIDLSGAVNRLNNTYGESKIVVELTDSLGSGEKYQVNFCQFKDDVHNDFDQQELVFTGVLRTDIENLGSGNPATQDLIGGDIFITPYYFSAVTPWDVFVQPVLASDPSFRGYQRVLADFPSVYSSDITYNDFDGAVNVIIHPGLGVKSDKRVYDVLGSEGNTLFDYVVAIGIPNFEIGEYTDNPLLRHRGEGGLEKYAKTGFEMEGEDWGYPAILDVTVPNITRFSNFPDFPTVSDFWIEWNTFYEQYDNYIGYNPYYSLQNTIKPAFPYGPNSEKWEVEDFSTRVIRSKKDSNSFASTSWRTFLENDRFDFARNKGQIIKLTTMQNRLLVHMEKTFHVMGARSELVTSDQRAFVGAGDIFTVPPQEIVDTEGGYAGLQDPLGAVVTQFGYFFVDRWQKKAFLYSGKLNEISQAGMRNYYQDNIDENGKVIVGVESDQNRLFVTHEGTNDWTISYLSDVSAWESFHSYLPDHYIVGATPLLTIKGRDLWQHGTGNVGQLYGTIYPFEIHFSDNLQPDLEKTVSTLKLDTRVLNVLGVEDTEKTFDTFRIYNDRQDTGTKSIAYFTGTDGNARRTLGRWSINGFRDESNIDGGSQIPSWAQRRRLNSKYNVVELVYTNLENKKLSLIEAGIGYKPSNR
jgi:hypothetical protein